VSGGWWLVLHVQELLWLEPTSWSLRDPKSIYRYGTKTKALISQHATRPYQ